LQYEDAASLTAPQKKKSEEPTSPTGQRQSHCFSSENDFRCSVGIAASTRAIASKSILFHGRDFLSAAVRARLAPFINERDFALHTFEQ